MLPEPEQKIVRPRKVYLGQEQRSYVPIESRAKQTIARRGLHSLAQCSDRFALTSENQAYNTPPASLIAVGPHRKDFTNPTLAMYVWRRP